jgi:hypothetical protein
MSDVNICYLILLSSFCFREERACAMYALFLEQEVPLLHYLARPEMHIVESSKVPEFLKARIMIFVNESLKTLQFHPF